jgi:hypothetical protein
MMLLLAFVGGLGVGAWGYQYVQDSIMLAQENKHREQMDELFAELKRARVQVADLIGRE